MVGKSELIWTKDCIKFSPEKRANHNVGFERNFKLLKLFLNFEIKCRTCLYQFLSAKEQLIKHFSVRPITQHAKVC